MKRIVFLFFISIVLISCHKETDIYYCGNIDNEVYEVLVKEGLTIRSFETPIEAIKSAEDGGSVLLLSNNYPKVPIKIDGNMVSGEIKSAGDEYVCLAIPYSEGWTATVDGQEVDIHRVNEMYMGVEVGPGNHVIEFRYHTVLLAEGAAVSAASTLLAVGVSVHKSRRFCSKGQPRKRNI